MTPGDRRDDLVRDLVAIGAREGLDHVPDGLDARVLARLPGPLPARAPTPAARTASRAHALIRRLAPVRRRVLAVVLVVLATALLTAPPVRAAVARFLGFGAVQVRVDPDAPRSAGTPTPPSAGARLTPGQAAGLVDFPVVAPPALGAPDAVQVSADRRVVSMTWDRPGGRVRLDQLGAGLDYAAVKSARDVQFTSVAGGMALWFAQPHEVAVVLPGGDTRTEPPRLAAPTLIWEGDGATLRLEGIGDLPAALSLAGSVREVP